MYIPVTDSDLAADKPYADTSMVPLPSPSDRPSFITLFQPTTIP